MLTRDVNGDRIGNCVSVTSSQLVMMHLPLDVLNYVPVTGIQNSPTGDRPVGWQDAIVNSVVDAAEFLANGIIALGTFMIEVFVTIAEIGLSFLVKLANDVAQTVKEVAQAMVDAFCAFVDWAIEFIKSTFTALFAPIIDGIQGLIEGYQNEIGSAVALAVDEYDTKGYVSPGTIATMFKAIVSDLFWACFGLIIVIQLALMTVSAMTAGLGFLIQIAIGLGATILIEQAFGAIGSMEDEDDNLLLKITLIANGAIEDVSIVLGQLMRSLTDWVEQKDNETSSSWDVVVGVTSFLFGMFGAFFSGVDYVSGSSGGEKVQKTFGYAAKGIVCGFLSAVLGFASFVATGVNEIIASLVTSVIGVILGAMGMIYGFLDMWGAKNVGNKGFAGFAFLLGTISVGLTGYSIYKTVVD